MQHKYSVAVVCLIVCWWCFVCLFVCLFLIFCGFFVCVLFIFYFLNVFTDFLTSSQTKLFTRTFYQNKHGFLYKKNPRHLMRQYNIYTFSINTSFSSIGLDKSKL